MQLLFVLWFHGTFSMNKLPLRPVLSNIRTATSETAKYLVKFLSPLGKSICTINSTRQLVNYIKNQKVLDDYLMVSSHITCPFTMVLLDETIEFNLQKIDIDKEINTTIPKRVMKDILCLCTKNQHFSFNDEIYEHIDSVAMGFPVGPILTNIFMVELENIIILQLENAIKRWKIHLGETICFAKVDLANLILTILNSIHSNIKFTHEIEKDSIISFLDVLVMKKTSNRIHTIAYCK